MAAEQEADGFHIIEGREYIYTLEKPEGCQGQRYKVLRFILDVPSYQQKVLVKALTGRDKGMWFVCSLANFSLRYQLLEKTDAPQ